MLFRSTIQLIICSRIPNLSISILTVLVFSVHHIYITYGIRNMENGMVEMELQGETAALHQLLSRIRRGDRFIHVENLSCKPIPTQLKEKRFTVRY